MKHVVISLSGGMDSSTLLLRCLKEYDTVTAISFDYGQKHRVELERAESLVGYLNGNVEKTERMILSKMEFLNLNWCINIQSFNFFCQLYCDCLSRIYTISSING